MKTPFLLGVTLWIALASTTGSAEGVPEPGLILYGRVMNAATGQVLPRGVLSWKVRPAAGGAEIGVEGLVSADGSFSVRIPFETLLGSQIVSPAALATPPAPTDFTRTASLTFVSGGKVYPVGFGSPALGTFRFGVMDRARVEPLTLSVAIPPGEIPGDIDFVDTDGDGVSDSDEQEAGTDPYDASDYLRFTRIEQGTDGRITLEWQAAPGRRYRLVYADGLKSQVFHVLSGGLQPTASRTRFVDENRPSLEPRFYRVEAE